VSEGRSWPALVAVTDLGQHDPVTLLDRLRRLAEAARAGSLAILLRDPALSGRERLGLGRELRALCRQTEQELWVADRVDVALLLEADGLHLGEASVPASAARRLWGAERRVSRAWHTPQATPARELEGVDALLLSPLLAERKGSQPLGLAAIAELQQALALAIAEERRRPVVYALGGVTTQNAAACLAEGAQGVAAIGAALSPTGDALVGALGIAR
jgi:thiamine-phosphate pyrophosphorylase